VPRLTDTHNTQNGREGHPLGLQIAIDPRCNLPFSFIRSCNALRCLKHSQGKEGGFSVWHGPRLKGFMVSEFAVENQSNKEKRGIMLGTILLIMLILLLLGALPAWPYSRGWGYYPSGGLGFVLLILLILLLLGKI